MLLIEKKGNSLMHPIFVKINEEKCIKVATTFKIKMEEQNYIILAVKIFKNSYLFDKSGLSPILLFFWTESNKGLNFEHCISNFDKRTKTGHLAKQLIEYVTNRKINIEDVISIYYNFFLLKYFKKDYLIKLTDFDLDNFDFTVESFKSYIRNFSNDTLYST